jgi:hypothetical protein
VERERGEKKVGVGAVGVDDEDRPVEDAVQADEGDLCAVR